MSDRKRLDLQTYGSPRFTGGEHHSHNSSATALFEDVLRGLENLGALADEILLVRIKFTNAGNDFLESTMTQDRLREIKARLFPHTLSDNLLTLLDLADEWTQQASSGKHVPSTAYSASVSERFDNDSAVVHNSAGHHRELSSNSLSSKSVSTDVEMTGRKRKAHEAWPSLASRSSNPLEKMASKRVSPARLSDTLLSPTKVEKRDSDIALTTSALVSPVRTQGLPSSSGKQRPETREPPRHCRARSPVESSPARGEKQSSAAGKRTEHLQVEIGRLKRRIQSIEEREVSLSDLEGENSLLERQDTLKKRLLNCYEELAGLTGCDNLSGPSAPDVKLKFTKTRHPALNTALKGFIKTLPHRQNFPNVSDFFEILVQARSTSKLNVSNSELQEVSRSVLADIGEPLKAYRRSQYWTLNGSALTDEAFGPGNVLKPLPTDKALKKQLRKNAKTSQQNMENIDAEIERDISACIASNVPKTVLWGRQKNNLALDISGKITAEPDNKSCLKKDSKTTGDNSDAQSIASTVSSPGASDPEVTPVLMRLLQEKSQGLTTNKSTLDSGQSESAFPSGQKCSLRAKEDSHLAVGKDRQTSFSPLSWSSSLSSSSSSSLSSSLSSLSSSSSRPSSTVSSGQNSLARKDLSQMSGGLAAFADKFQSRVKMEMERSAPHVKSAMTASLATSVSNKPPNDKAASRQLSNPEAAYRPRLTSSTQLATPKPSADSNRVDIIVID